MQSFAYLMDFFMQNGFNFMVISAKISAFLANLLFFRREFISPRILLFLSVILSVYLVKTNAFVLTQNDSLYYQWIFVLITQAFFGFVIAFIINLFTEIFLAIGQYISIQSGLGFVNFFIPKVGNITPMSQFFLILATVIFFQMNAHLLLLQMVFESFHLRFSFDANSLLDLIYYSKIIFSSTLMLSLSVIIALLLSNLTLAFTTRFSPQMNIFAIGINLSLIICFLLLYLLFDNFTENGNLLLNDILAFLKTRVLHG